MITMETVRQVLGSAFKEDGDYLVCGYDQLHVCEQKGYVRVGTLQDASPENREMLIFDRAPAQRAHAAAEAGLKAMAQAEREARLRAKEAAQPKPEKTYQTPTGGVFRRKGK